MQKLLNGIDRISEGSGKLFAWLIVVLMVVVLYEVFMRYAMRMPTRWGYDAGYMLYGALFFMTGAYALSRNAHVRADVVYRLLRPRTQGTIDVILYIVFFFPAAFFFVYSGWEFAARSWGMREHSSASPFGPPVYHFKTLIPIAGALLLIQGVGELIRCIIAIRNNKWPPRFSDVEEIETQGQAGEIAESVAGQVQLDTDVTGPARGDGNDGDRNEGGGKPGGGSTR